jgi:hypothetical protein
MITIIADIFLILHGLVHLLYAGQGWRFFEIRPGMVWPDGAAGCSLGILNIS